jgi:hypothetical protein
MLAKLVIIKPTDGGSGLAQNVHFRGNSKRDQW